MSDPEPTATPEPEPAPQAPTPEPSATGEFVVGLRHRFWIWFALVVAVLVVAGVFVVLWGEVNDWTSDPGTWAKFPLKTYALIGTGVLAFTILYYLLLLVRREVPEHTYVVTGPEDASTTSGVETSTTDAPPEG